MWAFDAINRNRLWQNLGAFTIDCNLFILVRSLYRIRTGCEVYFSQRYLIKKIPIQYSSRVSILASILSIFDVDSLISS